MRSMKGAVYCAVMVALTLFLLTTRTAVAGHAGQVMALAFSPDGKTLLSGSADTTVRLWDHAQGRELRSFETDYELVKAVAFSPDGRTIVAGTDSGNLKSWDAASGRPMPSKKMHAGSIHGIAYSNDGRWMATASADMLVKIWDRSSERLVHVQSGHSNKVYAVAFSPDSQLLASAGLDGYVRIWSVAKGQEAYAFRAHSNWIGALVFSADSKYLLSAGADGKARLWNVASRQERQSFDGSGPYSAALSPDGGTVFAAYGKLIKKWKTDTGKNTATLSDHQCLIRTVVYAPDGKFIATAGGDTSIKLWDAESGKLLRTIGLSRACAQKESGVVREHNEPGFMSKKVWR